MDYGHNSDGHTRVHYTQNPTFINKIGSSIWATVFGICIVLAAFPTIYWNEVGKLSST